MRADIDYALVTAYTIYGTIGVKVWIYRGDILGTPDLSPNVQVQREKMRGAADRRGRRR
jgi:small subunit ribosomal protein S3